MTYGLIVTISKEVPTILNLGDQVIEIYKGNNFKGQTTIQVKASKDIGITGAHLLQKAYFERDKLQTELDELKKLYEHLIDERTKARGYSNEN